MCFKSALELNDKIRAYEEEIDRLSKEISTHDAVMKANTVLQEKVKMQGRQFALLSREYDEKLEILQEREEQLLRESTAVRDQSDALEDKDRDIASLRKEVDSHKKSNKELMDHVEEQNTLIKHLEVLQDETQQMFLSQQQSHMLEVASYKRTLSDLTTRCQDLERQNHELMKDLRTFNMSGRNQTAKASDTDKNGSSVDSEGFAKPSSGKSCPQCSSLRLKLDMVTEEYHLLQASSAEQERQLKLLEKSLKEQRKLTMSLQKASVETHSRKEEEYASLMAETEILLEKKEMEIQSLRKAHAQRLQRYKLLEKNYNLVVKQLETYDKEASFLDEEAFAKKRLATEEGLQQEDSESVWNELTKCKKELKNMKYERCKMQEELDQLRVKSATDDVIIQELKAERETSKQEVYDLEKKIKAKEDFVSPTKVYALESELKGILERSVKFEKEAEKFKIENEELSRKQKSLCDEIDTLGHDLNVLQSQLLVQPDREKESEATQTSFNDDVQLLLSDLNPAEHGTSKKLSSYTRPQVEALGKLIQTSPWMERSFTNVRRESQSTQTSDTMTPRYPVTMATEKNAGTSRVTTQPRLPTRHGFGHQHGSQQIFRGEMFGEEGRRRKKRSLWSIKYRAIIREHGSMKLRIASLLRQLKLLRSEKREMEQSLMANQVQVDSSRKEIITLQNKMDILKHANKRMSEDLEQRTKRHEETLKNMEKEASESSYSKIQFKEMEARYKLATSECARTAFQLKTTRGENEMLTGRLKDLQDRIIHLEKNLSQKKNLMENCKDKLKECQGSLQSEKEDNEELRKRMKALISRDVQRKEYIENLKNERLKILQESQNLKELLSRSQQELELKSRLLADSQALCSQAESAISEIERAAYIQLQGQADEHKKITSSSIENLKRQSGRSLVFETAIRRLCDKLLGQVVQMVGIINAQRQERKKIEKIQERAKIATQEARDLACSILDMSSSDLDEFMQDDLDEVPVLEVNVDLLRDRLDVELQKQSQSDKELLSCLESIVEKYVEFRMTTLREKSL